MKQVTIICLMLLTTCSVFAQTAITKHVKDWERAKAYTKAYLDAMPEDGYAFKPTPEIRSFAGQMDHLADANIAFVAAATGKKGPLEGSAEKMADQSKAAVTKAVLASYDFVITSLQGVNEADWNKSVKVFGRDITLGEAFEKAFEHQTHHRGQTTPYIRMKGATPPQEMLF
ncbi:DinB family protein [Dyadobacter sp.]|uniref:DinB family protein n=1 Tax=Dyadobacter sp. TaxID=1914288 RepID=UPI003F70EAE0